MKFLHKGLLFSIMLIFSHHVIAAWDGDVAGKVKQIQITDGNNYGFRITLEGTPKLCGNEHSWAYVNESDSNYSVYVSVLIAAKAAKQDIRIYTNRKDGSADGYCHIGHVYIL